MALAPTAMKFIDAATRKLSDPNTIRAALTFTSYIVAGFQTGAEMAQALYKVIFQHQHAPRWVVELKAHFFDIAALAVTTYTSLKALEMVTAGNVAGGAIEYAAGMAVGTGLKAAADVAWRQAQAMPNETGPDTLADMGARFHGLQKSYDKRFQDDYTAAMTPPPAQPPPVKIKVDAKDPAFEAFVTRIVQQLYPQIWRQMRNDPETRKALRRSYQGA